MTSVPFQENDRVCALDYCILKTGEFQPQVFCSQSWTAPFRAWRFSQWKTAEPVCHLLQSGVKCTSPCLQNLFFSQSSPSEIHKSSEDRWAQGIRYMWYALASMLTSPFYSIVFNRRLLLDNVILHRDFPVADFQVSPTLFNSVMWRVHKNDT